MENRSTWRSYSLQAGQTFSMRSNNLLTKDTELRKLPAVDRLHLATILDIAEGWKELALHITRPDCDNNVLLLTASDIRTLEELKFTMQGSPTQALLDHWSTTGRVRPTIQTLLDLLILSQLYRAADYVSVEVLKGSPIERPTTDDLKPRSITSEPVAGPCLVNLPDYAFCNLFPHYSYSSLKSVTNNFQDISFHNGGNKLGEGAYGGVYFGDLKHLKQKVAVKRLKDKMDRPFFTELEVLAQFQHDNLLPLFGYSIDGPEACLVYEYMQNGSLQDRLAIKDERSLNWKQRLIIAVGSAKGICHLHNHLDNAYIHRDIKSANILLDENLNPKVGDFGLARMGGSQGSLTTKVTSTVVGTSCYMPLEAIHGDISVKLDTFSYGIVLLELLTSLPPYDQNREEKDILSHIQDNYDDRKSLIDNFPEPWDPEQADRLFDISMKCTEHRKKNRPFLTEVLPGLEEMLNNQ